MPRPAKSVDLILLEGNKSHLCKSEIERRRKAEKSLASGEAFHESPQVKTNKIAHREFIRLKRLYQDIPYIDALDEGIINRYCLEVANAHDLRALIESLSMSLQSATDSDERLSITDRLMSATRNLNRCSDMLLKLEDRLLLNPTARVKSVPMKQEPAKEEPAGIKRFLNNRQTQAK